MFKILSLCIVLFLALLFSGCTSLSESPIELSVPCDECNADISDLAECSQFCDPVSVHAGVAIQEYGKRVTTTGAGSNTMVSCYCIFDTLDPGKIESAFRNELPEIAMSRSARDLFPKLDADIFITIDEVNAVGFEMDQIIEDMPYLGSDYSMFARTFSKGNLELDMLTGKLMIVEYKIYYYDDATIESIESLYTQHKDELLSYKLAVDKNILIGTKGAFIERTSDDRLMQSVVFYTGQYVVDVGIIDYSSEDKEQELIKLANLIAQRIE
jgi:hypothetical protein